MFLKNTRRIKRFLPNCTTSRVTYAKEKKETADWQNE